MREHDKDAVNQMDKFVHYGPYGRFKVLKLGVDLASTCINVMVN